MGRRSRILFLSFTIVALVVTLILVAGCGTEESADLDPTKIAEYNKPGTVLVETVWTADVSFPELAIDYDALETAFINAVRDGTVSPDATTEEIATVLITELATFPELYLYATTEDRVTTMEASVYGSGFIVSDDGYVVTNAHIVKKSDEALAATMAEENAGELLQEDLAKFEEELGIDLPAEYEDYFLAAAADIYATYYTVSSPASDTSMYMVSVGDESISDAIPAEVVEVGDPMDIQEETGKDVAVLKVNKTNLPTVAMGDDKELMDGDQVLALGYPGTATFDYVLDINAELSPTLTQGTVSAKKTVSGGWEVIQSDAYTTNGSSGSPLLNMKGEAIGVNTFGAGDVNESTGEFEASPGFNFAIPATVINEFLNQANVEPAIGSLTDTYREAIDLYMDKHYSAAKEKFQEIYDANSDFPYVQDYIEQSSAKVSAGEDVSTFPAWIIIVIIVAGVILTGVIVLVVILVTRKGGKKGGTPPGAPVAATAVPAAAPSAPAPEAGPPAAETGGDAATTEMPKPEAPATEDSGAADAGGARFCSKCGNELDPGSAFCSKCGRQVNG